MSSQSDPDVETVRSFGYELQRNVGFGKVTVAPDGKEFTRELKFDIYRPIRERRQHGVLPAVIYVHGGAFHRGGRMQPPYKDAAVVHSRPEDFARLLAPLGYVVFVVEYRLATDNPEPILQPGDPNLRDVDDFITPAFMEATTRARLSMGLDPLEGEEGKLFLWKACIAAAEDVKMALDFIIDHAGDFNVDPERIAIGGHSAGGATTLNVGLGLQGRVAALFALSGTEIAFEHDAVANFDKLPASLIVASENDWDAILESFPMLIQLLTTAQAQYEMAWVSSPGHFYAHNMPTYCNGGTRMSLGDRVIAFLELHLSKEQSPARGRGRGRK